MHKSTKIFLWIFSLTAIILLISIGFIAKNRYFKENPEEKIQEEKIISTEKPNPSNQPLEDEMENFLKPEDKEEDLKEESELKRDFENHNTEEKESYLKIDKNDCEKNCSDFKKDTEDFKYCQEVCGIKEIEKKSSKDECEDLEGLEMDYCLRDLAVSKKDYKMCEEIEDKNISQNCQHRITEEILEDQKK